MLHEMFAPEITTILRWFLRGILVAFLVWLVRRRSEDDDDEEWEQEETYDTCSNNENGSYWQHHRYNNEVGSGTKGMGNHRGNDNNYGGNLRNATQGRNYQQRRDTPLSREYMPHTGANTTTGNLRNRRNIHGDVVNFDAVIDKLSKPKQMWEVRKSGEAPQILSHVGIDDGGTGNGGPYPAAAVGMNGNGSNSNHASVNEPTHSNGNSATVHTPTKGNERYAGGDRAPKLQLTPATTNGNGETKDDRLPKPTLHGHERPVTYIVWNHECNLLFTCGKDKVVSVWSFPEGECLGSYRGHNGAVWACSVTASSRWLVTCGADRLIIVWEARNSKEVARTELAGVVRSVEWAKTPGDSERFVACYNRFGSHLPAIVIHNFKEESEGSNVSLHLQIRNLPSAASQVRWGKNDQMVVSAHECGKLVFWDAETGSEIRSLQAHDAAISKFSWSTDCDLVATASQDKCVKVWDLVGDTNETGAISENLLYTAATNRPLNAVALGPITREEAVGAPDKRPKTCVLIAAGGQDIREVATTGSSSEQFETLLFRLGDDSAPASLVHIGSSKGHFGPVHTLAFTSDGSAIASGSEDGCVRLSMVDSVTTSPYPAATNTS